MSALLKEKPILVAAFYHFADMGADYRAKQMPYKNALIERGVKGTILCTPEGLNGTISGPREGVESFFDYLRQDVRFKDVTYKESFMDEHPFGKTKVKIKQETISIGEPACAWNAGKYVAPKDWNVLIADPDTLLIDTRNDYEYVLGTFKGAVNPETQTFKELPDVVRKLLKKHTPQKVAMFCTGGIRCEKSTAWLKDQGFEEVYHLQGGILQYLEDIPKEESLWEGECYVFDDRVAVDHDLNPSKTAVLCQNCGGTIIARDMTSSVFKHGKQCLHCAPWWEKKLYFGMKALKNRWHNFCRDRLNIKK